LHEFYSLFFHFCSLMTFTMMTSWAKGEFESFSTGREMIRSAGFS